MIVDQGSADQALHALLAKDSRKGWRVFVDRYTPTMLAIIEQAGVRRQDDAMDVYVRVCEHLAANGCARLRRHDPAKGPLAAWLTIVIRRVIVDWVRSRTGRRRLFQSIRALSPRDRRVFELRYWQRRPTTEIVEALRQRGEAVTLIDVFESCERIEGALSPRQRGELLSLLSREEAVSLEGDPHAERMAEARGGSNPERDLGNRQTAETVRHALAALPPEDALIVTLLYVDDLSKREVERALHIPPLTAERIERILARLKEHLERLGVSAPAAGPVP